MRLSQYNSTQFQGIRRAETLILALPFPLSEAMRDLGLDTWFSEGHILANQNQALLFLDFLDGELRTNN